MNPAPPVTSTCDICSPWGEARPREGADRGGSVLNRAACSPAAVDVVTEDDPDTAFIPRGEVGALLRVIRPPPRLCRDRAGSRRRRGRRCPCECCRCPALDPGPHRG